MSVWLQYPSVLILIAKTTFLMDLSLWDDKCEVQALLDRINNYRIPKLIYSLRSSSSGVGFWKDAIHGFIIFSGMVKLACEFCEFLIASRRISSSSGTSRKCTSLLA